MEQPQRVQHCENAPTIGCRDCWMATRNQSDAAARHVVVEHSAVCNTPTNRANLWAPTVRLSGHCKQLKEQRWVEVPRKNITIDNYSTV